MRPIRKTVMITLLCVPLITGGCSLEELGFAVTSELSLFVRLFNIRTAKPLLKSKRPKIADTSNVSFSGMVDGRNGDYDLTLGTYGSAQGTAELKGKSKAKIREDNSEMAQTVVAAAVKDRLGIDVLLSLAKVRFNGREAKNGTKLIYNLRIKFEGLVIDGEHQGKTVKGKLKLKGNFEPE